MTSPGMTRNHHRSTQFLLCFALVAPLASGCAVVTVAGAAAGAVISVTGAVVSTTVSVAGKVVEKTIDVVTPSGNDSKK
jgi:hypothetical protein